MVVSFFNHLYRCFSKLHSVHVAGRLMERVSVLFVIATVFSYTGKHVTYNHYVVFQLRMLNSNVSQGSSRNSKYCWQVNYLAVAFQAHTWWILQAVAWASLVFPMMLGIISQCHTWSRARRPCVFPPLTLLFDICFTVLFSGVSHRQYVFISWRVSWRRRINLRLRLSVLCVVYMRVCHVPLCTSIGG